MGTIGIHNGNSKMHGWGDDPDLADVDYSLKSKAYYLAEIEMEEQFIATHPEHPDRFAAQANIDYCQECLAKIENAEKSWSVLAIDVRQTPPEPLSLNEMSLAEQAVWFASLPEIDPNA